MRGFAAILVTINHIGMNHDMRLGASAYLAVDFFFMLSGFVIALAYESRLQASFRFVDFLAARIIRLYPLLLLGMLFGVVKFAAQVVTHDPQTLSPAAFLGSLTTGIFILPSNIPGFTEFYPHGLTIMPLNTPQWSLFFEMAANIAFGALLYRLSTAKLGLVVLCTGLLHAYGVVHVTDKAAGVLPFAFVWGFPRVFFGFSAGMLLYRFLRDAPRRATQLAHLPAAVLVLILAAAPSSIAMRWFEIGTIFVALPLILTAGALWEIPEQHRNAYGLMGDISYPLYIMHFPLLMAFLAIGDRLDAPLLLMTLAFLVGMSLFSYAALRLFDEPARAWLSRHWRNRDDNAAVGIDGPSNFTGR